MKRALIAAALTVALGPVAATQRVDPTGNPGQLTSEAETLQAEVLISTLPGAELTKQLTAAAGTIEHKSEVARGGPVAAVVRAPGCMKDTAGTCKATADVVIYKPDSATGLYRAVVTVRDLTARRFATLGRQFGVR